MEADYIIVGAGLTGATIARILHDAGAHVIVLEARERVGGNVADVLHRCGIRYNLRGPHYFRTSSSRIQTFVARFAEFYPFAAVIMSQVGDELFPWPLHRSCFERFAVGWSPDADCRRPAANFEEAMLALMPPAIYQTFIEGYSAKQWGVSPTMLDASLARRIEVRDDGDLRLSQASFQAIPRDGYTRMVETMLADIDVRVFTDFHEVSEQCHWRQRLIYTGPIDRFFDYRHGPLPYRTQDRVDVFIPGVRSLYPCGQVNLPLVAEGHHVRTVEWRHMLPPGQGPATGTLLTLEFPGDATDWRRAEYPFPSLAARQHYERYLALTPTRPDVLFCGRLGEYRYLDMDQAIARGMMHAEKLLEEVVGEKAVA